MIEHRRLLQLFLLAVAIRACFGLIQPEHPRFADSQQYLAMAENIQAGNGPIINQRLKAYRAPGYPFFLAGVSTLLGHDIRVLRVVQAFVGALVPLLLVLLGQELGEKRAGWLAGLAAACYPHLVYFSARLLTETQFTLLLLLAMLILARAHGRSSWRLSLAGGAALGLATLTRFSLGLLPLALIPVWFWHTPRPRRQFVFVLLGFTLVLAPWSVRNYRILGSFVPLSTHLGHHAWEVLGPQATGGPVADHITWPEGTHTLDELARDRMLKRKTWEHVQMHPARTIGLVGRKFLRYWSPLPNDPAHRTPLYILASLASFGVVLLLALAALLQARRRLMPLWPLWLPLLYYTAVQVTISMGSIRYRVPIEPYLILLAATAVAPWIMPEESSA